MADSYIEIVEEHTVFTPAPDGVEIEILEEVVTLEIATVVVQGPPGLGAGIDYIHDQSTPSDDWPIIHSFGYRPAVDVYNRDWVEVAAEVVHVSLLEARVRPSTPTTGWAIARR